jgi:transposase
MDADHELKMNLSHREIRVLLLHEFRLGHKATEAANNICSTMGEDVLSIRTAQHWFNRFKNGNLELDDLPRPGRPLEVDVDLLKQLIEQDPRLTLRCLAEQLGCSHTAVEKHLNELGKTW